MEYIISYLYVTNWNVVVCQAQIKSILIKNRSNSVLYIFFFHKRVVLELQLVHKYLACGVPFFSYCLGANKICEHVLQSISHFCVCKPLIFIAILYNNHLSLLVNMHLHPYPAIFPQVLSVFSSHHVCSHNLRYCA